MLGAWTRVAVLLVVLTQALLLCHRDCHATPTPVGAAGLAIGPAGGAGPLDLESAALVAACPGADASVCTGHALPGAKPVPPAMAVLGWAIAVTPPLLLALNRPVERAGPLPVAVRCALPLLN